jgi:hypothetical protein
MSFPLKFEIAELDKRLIEKLNATHRPIKVDIIYKDWVEPNECIDTILRQIQNEKGECVYGWNIYKTKLLNEAEFHCIWKDLNGKYVDIRSTRDTLYHLGFKQSIFIEDDNIKYEGKPIDNIRINLTNNPLVDDFILCSETIFKFENKGDRAYKQELRFNKMQPEYVYYFNILSLKNNIKLMAEHDVKMDDECICENGKKYSQCCHEMLKNMANNIL